jgi:hypothetical protein
MATLHTSNLKQDKIEKSVGSQDQWLDFNSISQFWEDAQITGIRRLFEKLSFLKRVSPLCIVAACLPVLFVYATFNNVHNTVFFFVLFLFAEANILTIDFAIWNYHRGHKIVRVWMIELIVILSALYFIV